jgi:DNA-binding transcriptional regulator YdaS (Cro superfamily)
MDKAAYIQTLEHAATITGGHSELAALLGVTREELLAWTTGSCIPGPALFLRVMEVVLSDLQRQLDPEEAR